MKWKKNRYLQELNSCEVNLMVTVFKAERSTLYITSASSASASIEELKLSDGTCTINCIGSSPYSQGKKKNFNMEFSVVNRVKLTFSILWARKTESMDPRIQTENFLGKSFKLETSGHRMPAAVADTILST